MIGINKKIDKKPKKSIKKYKIDKKCCYFATNIMFNIDVYNEISQKNRNFAKKQTL